MSDETSVGPDLRPPFVREGEITSRYRISRGTQRRLREHGILPAGIRLGARLVIYSEPAVVEAIAGLAKAGKGSN